MFFCENILSENCSQKVNLSTLRSEEFIIGLDDASMKSVNLEYKDDFFETNCKENIIKAIQNIPRTPFYDNFIKQNNVYLPHFSLETPKIKSISNENIHLPSQATANWCSTTVRSGESLNSFGEGATETKPEFIGTKCKENIKNEYIELEIPHGERCYLIYFKDSPREYMNLSSPATASWCYPILCSEKFFNFKDILLETVFCGTLTELRDSSERSVGEDSANISFKTFVIDDLFYYKGEPMFNNCYGEKLFYIYDFLKLISLAEATLKPKIKVLNQIFNSSDGEIAETKDRKYEKLEEFINLAIPKINILPLRNYFEKSVGGSLNPNFNRFSEGDSESNIQDFSGTKCKKIKYYKILPLLKETSLEQIENQNTVASEGKLKDLVEKQPKPTIKLSGRSVEKLRNSPKQSVKKNKLAVASEGKLEHLHTFVERNEINRFSGGATETKDEFIYSSFRENEPYSDLRRKGGLPLQSTEKSRKKNIFYVMAGLQYDIYYLFTKNPLETSIKSPSQPTKNQDSIIFPLETTTNSFSSTLRSDEKINNKTQQNNINRFGGEATEANEEFIRTKCKKNGTSFDVRRTGGQPINVVDVSHSFCEAKSKENVKISEVERKKIAYIPNIKTSIFMNSIFRNIRENKNIDFIEESDDENDFENTSEDKFVDLKKVVIMECIFHNKFKKWIPIRIIDKLKK
jgi:hypothetical protein